MLDLAAHATVPVINGLTNRTHPCQLMADIMTFEEHRGSIKDKVITWSGDGNNMATSWIHAAVQFEFELRLAVPEELPPPTEVVAWAQSEGGRVRVVPDVNEAVSGADCVVTDVWVSMGDDAAEDQHKLLMPYQVNDAVMSKAKADAVFMHCLPAHRGEEVSTELMSHPAQRVFDQAENRLHAVKAVLVSALRGR